MLSYQILEYYKFIVKELDNFEPSIEFLIDWESEYNYIVEETLGELFSGRVSKNSDGTHSYVMSNGTRISGFIAFMREFKANFNFLSLFTQYGEMKQRVLDYKKVNNVSNDYIEKFFYEIDRVLILYQEFIQSNDSRICAVELGQAVISFKSIYKTCKIIYNSYLMLSSNNMEIEKEDDADILEIQLLNVKYSFEEFIKKLNSINKIYCEIGNLITSESYTELKIIKIESGSLLSSVLGDKNIIEAVGKFLNKGIDLIFNKYTFEGKLYRQSELIKTLKENVELGVELKALGYDITESAENIEKTYTVLSKELLNIVSGSPDIKINNTSHKLEQDGIRNNYLKDARKLLLEEGKENN